VSSCETCQNFARSHKGEAARVQTKATSTWAKARIVISFKARSHLVESEL